LQPGTRLSKAQSSHLNNADVIPALRDKPERRESGDVEWDGIQTGDCSCDTNYIFRP
jgi:hypothetical protein